MYMYYVVLRYSDLGEGLRQVGEQVVDMFRADGETYRGLRDALLGQFRFIELGVAPFGKYVSYSLWSGCPGNAGWLTFFTLGCVERKSMIFRVFSTWRSTRKDKVSNP